jgi:hypothetical protein
MRHILFFIIFFIFPLPGFGQEGDEIVFDGQEEKTKNSHKLNSLTSLGKKDSSPRLEILMDEKVAKELIDIFKDNPLAKVSSENVKVLVLKKASETPLVHKYLKGHPRVLNCIVDLLRDKKAIHAGLNIYLKKHQLRIYALIWAFLFIIQWMFRKIFFKKEWGFFKRFFLNTLIAIVFSAASISLFYRLFRPELRPAFEVIMKNIKSNRT